VESRDHDSLRKRAHKLKGTVTNFSAPDAYETAFALEKMGRDEKDWPEIEEKHAILDSSVNKLDSALKKFLSEENA